MLISEEAASDLKIWVMRKLEDISDADSDVLADYVIALIRSDIPSSTLRNNTIAQLEDFLHQHAGSFVDELLHALAHQTFKVGPIYSSAAVQHSSANVPPTHALDLNKTANWSSTQAIQDDRITLERGQKRNSEDVRNDSDHNLSDQNHMDTRHKRKREGSVSQNGRPPQARTYNAVQNFMPSSAAPSNIFTNNPVMFPFNDPQSIATAMLSMQTMSSPGPMNQTALNGDGRQPCLDYETQGLCVRGTNCPYDHGDNQIIVPQATPFGPISASFMKNKLGFGDTATLLSASNLMANMQGSFTQPHRARRSELSMPGPNHNRDITSVVIEQIPEENFEEDQVRKYFSTFGHIKEISMQAYKRLAIVTFSQYQSAKAAYESPKAIFGNRFVRVYWCNAGVIPKSKPVSSPTIRKETDAEAVHASEKKELDFDPADVEKKTAEAQRKFDERNKRRQELEMESQKIDQQCRELEKNKNEMKMKLDEKLREMGLDPSPDMIPVNGLRKTKRQRDADLLKVQLVALEARARELGLDLQALNADTRSEDNSYYSPPSRSRGEKFGYRSYRSYRGKIPYSTKASRTSHRGSSGPKGGFGAPFKGAIHGDGKYNLDLRSRRIRLTVVDDEQWSEDKDEALREHLFDFGEFECIESVPIGEAGDAIITFKDRPTAETFYYSSHDVANIGSFNLEWIPNSNIAKASATSENGSDVVMNDNGTSSPPESINNGRSETVSSLYERHNDNDIDDVDERWIVR